MSSLLENIINNKHKNLKFNFSKSISENIAMVSERNPSNSVPIATKESSWDVVNDNDSTFMMKTYYFNFNKHLIYFITEVLQKANKINHHPVVLIDDNVIEIKLFTKDINDVTEVDIEYSKFIDEIYEEINYILEF